MSYTEEENVVSFFGLVVLAVDGVYDEKCEIWLFLKYIKPHTVSYFIAVFSGGKV